MVLTARSFSGDPSTLRGYFGKVLNMPKRRKTKYGGDRKKTQLDFDKLQDPDRLSSEERDRMAAALAMSALANGGHIQSTMGEFGGQGGVKSRNLVNQVRGFSVGSLPRRPSHPKRSDGELSSVVNDVTRISRNDKNDLGNLVIKTKQFIPPTANGVTKHPPVQNLQRVIESKHLPPKKRKLAKEDEVELFDEKAKLSSHAHGGKRNSVEAVNRVIIVCGNPNGPSNSLVISPNSKNQELTDQKQPSSIKIAQSETPTGAVKNHGDSKKDSGEVVATETARPSPMPIADPRLSFMMLQECQMAIKADEDGDLPLHIAVVQEDLPTVEKLIPLMQASGVTIDYCNKLRQTPLHLAVITGQQQMVQRLLQAGACANIPDRHGNTSLHLAVKNHCKDCLKTILAHTKSKLHLDAKNYEGFAAMHLAVQKRELNLLSMLLGVSADIDVQDGKSGRTPLYHACETNQLHLVEMLLKQGASVNLQCYSGATALHAASGRGHMDIVALLVRFGADTTVKNANVDFFSSRVEKKGKSPSTPTHPRSPGMVRNSPTASRKAATIVKETPSNVPSNMLVVPSSGIHSQLLAGGTMTVMPPSEKSANQLQQTVTWSVPSITNIRIHSPASPDKPLAEEKSDVLHSMLDHQSLDKAVNMDQTSKALSGLSSENPTPVDLTSIKREIDPS